MGSFASGVANSIVDSLHKFPVVPPQQITEGRQDPLSLQHRVGHSAEESTPTMAVRFNRALRDKRAMRPGPGRWVEYILPDLRRVYIESNLRKMYLGRMSGKAVVARVLVKPGGSEYTNDLHSLIMMRMVEVSGDMLDVVRTADKVGLYVSDPETRSQRPQTKELRSNQIKHASEENSVSLAKQAADRSGQGSTGDELQNRVQGAQKMRSADATTNFAWGGGPKTRLRKVGPLQVKKVKIT